MADDNDQIKQDMIAALKPLLPQPIGTQVPKSVSEIGTRELLAMMLWVQIMGSEASTA